MKQALGLKLSQGLSLTPALQQAIKLLQMSTLDLQQEIQEALDSNLMLQREDEIGEAPVETGPTENPNDSPDTAEASDERGPEDSAAEFEWDELYTQNSGDVEAATALYEFRQANIHTATDLKEHLQEQASLEDFAPAELLAVEHLIDALDSRGFLPDWAELGDQVATSCGLPLATVEALRRRLQQWDPTGVGAVDLRECLLLQLALEPDSATRRLAQQLVADHLAALGDGQATRLAAKLGCEVAELEAAAQLIRGLNPDPGAAFVAHEDQYVAPDAYVRKVEGHWIASINPDIAPKLRINAEYQALVQRAGNTPDQQLLRQHLQEARYFLHSLKSRNETLLRVAQEIVDRQRGFLEYGPEAMRPLVLRDIAGRLGIHESTVSRATAHKYLHTPRGLFELKYFFSSAVSTAQGGSCSATAIQAMIRRLIADESSAKPLSDSQLTKNLQEQGINVARRTVAKYREGMDIAPSHERKRMA